VLVIEPQGPGGQPASSSKIENYIGFPTGISGQDLAGRAFAQAEKFGSELLIAKSAKTLVLLRRDVHGIAAVHRRTGRQGIALARTS
jgi:thioredoxin reductase